MNNVFQKVIFWLMVVVGILASTTITALQLLPFGMFVVFASLKFWGKKDTTVAILVLSVIMLLANLAIQSWFDVALWACTIVAFHKE